MDSLGDVSRTKKDNRGNQTLVRLINEIKATNLSPTHFLLVNYQFSTSVSDTVKHRIRKLMYNRLNGKTYHKILGSDGDVVFIKWNTHNKTSSNLFYTTSRFEETYIRQLTKGLITSLYEEILKQFNLTSKNFQLTFLTTKNINYEINLDSGVEEVLGVIPGTPYQLVSTDNECIELTYTD